MSHKRKMVKNMKFNTNEPCETIFNLLRDKEKNTEDHCILFGWCAQLPFYPISLAVVSFL